MIRIAILALTALVLAGCSDPAPIADPPPATPSPAAPEPTPKEEKTKPPPTPSAAEQAELDRRLIEAAWDDDLVRARTLIARGADVNTQDDTQQSAYLISTSEGYYELLELTLRHGARVEAKDSFNGTGVIRAAERGHWDVVGRLVRAGVPVDHVNNLGWTGLHESIILGDGSQSYVDTVRVLVAAGADVTLPSERDGVSPVQHARAQGFDEIGDLLEAAERVDGERIGPAAADARLLAAAAAGDADAVALALRSGARLEARDERERTALLLASTYDRVDAARVLVALGADPDALDDRHDTPWLVTGVTGSVPMLEVLLPAHPDLGIRNRYGGVSVIPASERGHVAYVRRVVTTAIDVNHVNDLGWTALLEAVILGDGSRPYQQIVRALIGAGADSDLADGDGTSALAHAEARGQTVVAGILRRAG
jgi:ankyrin repeat protein